MTSMIQAGNDLDIQGTTSLDKFLGSIMLTQSELENEINLKVRKLNGVYFTNELAILNNINNIIKIDDHIFHKRILEPACGHGIFLLHIIANLYKVYPDKKLIRNFIETNLIFIDINPTMIEITKQNINKLFKYLFDEDYCGQYNGFSYDFTEKFTPNLLNKSNKHALANYLGKIDYIIGNPPYVSLYGRRDKKQNEQQRITYLNNYKQFPATVKNGKINLVMLFIEHALDFLKNESYLSFIIDVSFFETAYKHTRKYLLENTKILSLEHNLSNFSGVASGQLILKLEKNIINKNHSVIVKNFSKKESIMINQTEWDNSNDEYKFRINKCKDTEEIIGKIYAKRDNTLKELFPKKNLRTCVMLLDMEDLFVFETTEPKENISIYPYYQGSKSLKDKFCELTTNKYFYYDKKKQDVINDNLKAELTKIGIKNKKRLGLGETKIYDNPKIFIRQSAKEIIATYEEKPSAANNSLYVFSLRNNDQKSKEYLKFICGLLNSKLITFYAQKRNIIRFSNGKQPQIKTSDLYTIRIPRDVKLQTCISNLVSEIYTKKNSLTSTMENIDELLFKYYDISSDEIKFIEQSIKCF